MSDECQPNAGTVPGAAAERERPQEDASARASKLAGFVEGMARGEQESLARLYDETSSLIHGLLRRMLEYQEDAEEALLDVYMKAWRNAPSYTADRGAVQPWLVIMARNIAIDKIRQKRAQPKTFSIEFDYEMELISSSASPEQQTQQAQTRRAVQAGMRELPAEQREVLELAFFGGLTHSELAKRFDQPLGTIKTRIRIGLLRLKGLMEKGVTA
jgi:RNA polymerase sigma-70 factor (ECF subfamily)